MRENNDVQRSLGATWIKLLDPDMLKARFPWLNTDGLALGAFGEKNEGYFDPWALLQAMKKGAIARGVTFVEQTVSGFDVDSRGKITAVRLGSGESLTAGTVVNAAGPHGSRIVAMCGEAGAAAPLPVQPRKRSVFQVHTDVKVASDGVTPPPPHNTPLTVDPCGVYIRSESNAGRFLCGVSPCAEDDPDCNDLQVLEHPDHELFEGTIWPALAERCPALEALKVESSWAGFYEYNTMDQNGVVGFHPNVTNLLVACGFSGHGLQQAAGVGRACAELLLHGGFKTIDLSSLGYDRIVRQDPLFERGIV